MKTISKLILILIILFLIGCQTEEYTLEGTHFGIKSKTSIKTLHGEDVNKITLKLKDYLKNSKHNFSSLNSSTMRAEDGTIDFNNILEVIDSLGIKNYTFKIINHPDDNYKIFHNLVLTEKDETLKATLMKYEMDENFAQDYILKIKDFNQFYGSISAISLEPINAIDPCDPIVVDIPAEAGGFYGTNPNTGNNGTPGSSSSGSGCVTANISYVCTGNPSYGPCGATYGDFGSYRASVCGNGNYNLNIVINYSSSIACRGEGDPCVPKGEIGVIENPPLTIAELIEARIDDSELDECTRAILNSLKNLQNNDISKIIARFNNPETIYNTKFQISSPTNPNALATTNWVQAPNSNNAVPFNYLIKVRQSFLDGTFLTSSIPPKKPTKLAVARTILHELIHAYFDSLLDDCYYNNNCADIKQFPELWDLFVAFKNNGDTSDASHIAMAKLYAEIIASALKEYQTGNAVLNNPIGSDQDYLDLAWNGLQSSSQFTNSKLNDLFNQEYPWGSDKRIRYEKINNAENKQESTSYLNIFPKSVPCQ